METVKGLDVGVYRIRNVQNGRVYIGSSKTLEKRLKDHRKFLGKGTHSNRYLQHDWNKCGKDAFVFEVVERTTESSQQFVLEQHWLDQVYDHQNQCYNFRANALQDVRSCHSKTPIQTNEKQSQTWKKLWANSEFHEAQRLRMIASRTPGWRDNLSSGQKKRWAEDKTNQRQAVSERAKKLWQDPEFRSKASAKENHVKGAAARTEHTIARHKERMARHKETVEEWVSVGPHCRRFENANLLSPDGVLYVNVTNVQKFAETFGLSESKVRDVIKMKLLTYKGWSKFIDIETNRDLFERSVGKKYITVSVTPEREGVCSEVIGGQTRYAHRAWMKSPEGDVLEVRNVKEFRENHSMNKSAMTSLLNGSLLTWKGWTLHGEPKAT